MNYDKYLENEKDTETAVTMGVIYPVAEGEFNLPTSILKRKALISSHYILQTGASHDYSFITLMVHGEVRYISLFDRCIVQAALDDSPISTIRGLLMTEHSIT